MGSAFITRRAVIGEIGMELLADIAVNSSNSATDITGLDIGKDDEILLIADIVNGAGINANYKIYFNGNYTDINYDCQLFYSDGTGHGTSRYAYPYIANVLNGNQLISRINIKVESGGYCAYQAFVTRNIGTASVSLNTICGSSAFTVSSITSIRIASEETNAIGVGSRIKLYRMGGA